MKRNISLVSYESSDDDAEDIRAGPEMTATKRKLPKLSPSLTVPVPVDNPALHRGRRRATPHVEGQFAAFVYVAIPLTKDAPLRTLLERAITQAKEVEPSLVCDWPETPTTYSLHISLTRPIYLRHHQREDLKRAVKVAARSVCSFTISFSSFATFTNDERTRAFLGIEVGAGHRELESLSKAVEPALRLLHQKEFYSDPRFHASIAWALLVTDTSLQSGAPNVSTSGADVTSLPRAVSSLQHCLPDLNERLGQSLSSTKARTFEVDRVCVKIGKEVTIWPLGVN